MHGEFQVTLNKSFRLMTKNSMLVPFKQKFCKKTRLRKLQENGHQKKRSALKSQMNHYQIIQLQEQERKINKREIIKGHNQIRIRTQNQVSERNHFGRYQNQHSLHKDQNRLETSINVFQSFFKSPADNRKGSAYKSSQKSKRNSNRISSHQESNKKENAIVKKMQSIKVHLNQQKLYDRLSHFSKQKGKNFLRIYKQDFRKIFVNRYGKDRITSFFQFQYIEDYDSILKTINDIFCMSFEQIVALSFLIMDFDRDGLISTADIINLIRFSDGNKLVLRDCVTVLKKFKPKVTLRGVQQVHDINQNQYFDESNQNQTLVRYRMQNKFKFEKNINLSNILLDFYVKQGRKKQKVTKNLSQHLFVINPKTNKKFQEQEQVNQKNREIIQKLFKNVELLTSKKKPQINFETFFKIFQNRFNPNQGIIIPGVFLDFIYVLGDIALPEEEYLEIDYSVIERKSKIQQKKKQQSSKIGFYLTSLQKLKTVNSEIKIQNFDNYFEF